MRKFAILGTMGTCGLLTGCTLYPTQTKPSLAMTTSAEQVQRIFWQDVAAGKWNEVTSLLAPNAVWRVRGEVIPTAQIVPWLKGLGVRAVNVSDVTLTPAVNDMNVTATVQIQAQRAVRAAASGTQPSCAGRPQTLASLAVWQQPQPTGTASKDKSYRGYLLTVQDLSSPAAAQGGATANDACE